MKSEPEEDALTEPQMRPRSRRPGQPGQQRLNAAELHWQRVYPDTDISPPSHTFSQSIGSATVLPDDSNPFDSSQIIT